MSWLESYLSFCRWSLVIFETYTTNHFHSWHQFTSTQKMPNQQQPQPLPLHQRATPQSVFKQDQPEKVYSLIERCNKLTWLLKTTNLEEWIDLWQMYACWYQRAYWHIHDMERDIDPEVKPILIKRLQILEAELKVAYSLVTTTNPPPRLPPRVIEKDIHNITATFWPSFRYDIKGDPVPQLTIDYEEERFSNLAW